MKKLISVLVLGLLSAHAFAASPQSASDAPPQNSPAATTVVKVSDPQYIVYSGTKTECNRIGVMILCVTPPKESGGEVQVFLIPKLQ